MSVVVLGAGPAGCAAALTLLAAGVEVTIVERSAFPRSRPGETLHPGIEPLLNRLGVLRVVLDANYLRHTGHWVEWNGPMQFVPFGEDSRGPWRGFQAPRADFDRRLLCAAMRRGAVYLPRCSVLDVRIAARRVTGVDTAHGPIHAHFTIDCTGASRWLARRLCLSARRQSPPLLARFGYVTGCVEHPERLPQIRADRDGWTWMSEVERGRFHWTRVTRPEDRPAVNWLPELFRDLNPEPTRGADVTWRITSPTSGSGWFLAGDAAAVLDPSSSHGVLRAVMSGMLAGHMAAKVLRDGVDESRCAQVYDRQLREWFEHDTVRMAEAYHRAKLFPDLERHIGSELH